MSEMFSGKDPSCLLYIDQKSVEGEKGRIMPKMKTNRSAAKRFRLTKSGKLKKRSARRGHILTKMKSKAKRKLRQTGYVSSTDAKKIRRLLPYGAN